MVSLVQPGMYSVINKIYSTTSGYNAVKYTLQKDTTCDGKISMAGELVVKAKCMRCMKSKTKWYSEKTN